MKKMFPLFIFIISAGYLAISFSYDMFSRGGPGSGFLPRIIGIALVLLSGYDLIKSFKEQTISEEAQGIIYIKDMIVLIGLSTVYIFLFNLLGALISTLIFIISTLTYLNRNKWNQNLIIGIAVPAIIFIMFEILLNTGLPKGIFENWL